MQGFEELQRMYRQVLPEKCAALEQDWDAIVAGALPEPHAQSLRRQLHQLSGSGGAYGYDAMGEMARELEKIWVQWLGADSETRPEASAVCEQRAGLMAALLAAMRAASLGDEA
jgi:chemotaxis protein histidine kinase CheA